MSKQESLSIVVPVFNEEGNVLPLYEALKEQLDDLFLPFEIIFVNDGSRDNSLAVMKQLRARDPRVKIISFSRNFGHQNAVTAGTDYATGAAVIVMDSDLQHPPELIPQMIAHWREGYQVVYTIREDKKDIGFIKKVTSRMFYRLINWISETPVIAGAADFRLMDRQVVDCLTSMQERSRFLRGMISWVGFQQVGIRYVPNQRHSGHSKYSLRRMLSFALQGITSFSSVPLRISGYVGFIAAVAWIPYAVWAIYAKLFTTMVVPGWTSLLVAILFLGGVQLLSIGVIGEYIGRIYTEVKGRPLYIAQETHGFRDGRSHGQLVGSDVREQRIFDRVDH